MCQKLRGHGNPCTQTNTCLCMYTDINSDICFLSPCQTEYEKKLVKGKQSSCSTNTHTHTEDSILQTGQPFKQLSVTVTHGNSKTCPLSLPPQETQIHCPVKGELNELAHKSAREWKEAVTLPTLSLLKCSTTPLLKVQEVNYSTWKNMCGRTEWTQANRNPSSLLFKSSTHWLT